MCVVPGPASQDTVIKRVYASQGLQCINRYLYQYEPLRGFSTSIGPPKIFFLQKTVSVVFLRKNLNFKLKSVEKINTSSNTTIEKRTPFAAIGMLKKSFCVNRHVAKITHENMSLIWASLESKNLQRCTNFCKNCYVQRWALALFCAFALTSTKQKRAQRKKSAKWLISLMTMYTKLGHVTLFFVNSPFHFYHAFKVLNQPTITFNRRLLCSFIVGHIRFMCNITIIIVCWKYIIRITIENSYMIW
jgi:hypothetical protein